MEEAARPVIAERLSHPLFGSVATAFVVWNWKFFYTLVKSNQGAAESIADASATLGASENWWWLAPLVLGSVYALATEWLKIPFALCAKLGKTYSEHWIRWAVDKTYRHTAHTIGDHPLYRQQVERGGVLQNLVTRCWPEVGDALGLEKARANIHFLPVAHPVTDDRGAALYFQVVPNGTFERISEGQAFNMEKAFCGFARTGETEVAAVPAGGLVPMNWSTNETFRHFVNGVAVLYPGASLPEQGPYIERVGSTQWGKFVGRNVIR